MIRFVGIFFMAALISACSTNPMASAQSQSNTSSVQASTLSHGGLNNAGASNPEKAQIKIGPSAIALEKMARHKGCEPVLGAELISQNGPVEVYEIKCVNGQVLGANCEYRQCKINAQTSPAVVAAASPAIAVAQPVALNTAPPTANNESQLAAQPSNVAATPIGPIQNETTVPPAYNQDMETGEGQQALVIPSRTLKFVLGLGFSSGGDTILTAYYSDNTSSSLKAGSGVQFYVGFDDRLSEHFSVQGTAGYLTDNASASNATLKFDRFPIELLGYYHLNRSWRIGGGIQLMESPKLDASGAASQYSMNFNNATGGILEAEWLVNPSFGIKLRAVKESFTATGYTGSLSGNQAAILFSVYY